MAERVMQTRLSHIATGGNRHPSAADWAPGLLAFGAGNNIALWNPNDSTHAGIFALLAGHTDVVNAVKIFDAPDRRRIVSGGADNTIRIWSSSSSAAVYEQSQCLNEHQGSVNTISILAERNIVVTGSADGTIKLWSYTSESKMTLIQSISLKPRYLPLTCDLIELADKSTVIAVAGSSSSIQLYSQCEPEGHFALQATLTGHEGWIRSLSFTKESNGDILLASSSQDKYIRLWRFRKSADGTPPSVNGIVDPTVATVKKSLSNKAHQVGPTGHKYNVTFEALLIGHEDWVYSARWASRVNEDSLLTLLSASADNSVAIWQPDETSGVWVCRFRLGEISAQKGSTTATGSAGGFWNGLWQPDGRSIVSLGRTGSWRRWSYDAMEDMWQQAIGISGHTKEVQSLAWASDGSYLLSTGNDQTTRHFAEWHKATGNSWHEFARPQIHGYDLNCIDSITASCFISGADEKLLRVFNKPKAIDELLAKLCGTQQSLDSELPDAANIPVLGLSNKAIAAAPDDAEMNKITENGTEDREAVDPDSIVRKSTLHLDHPPFEEHLARHTLWPEHEKLYGHGYEISAVVSSHDGTLVATACKASSIDHAVIRIYECKEWREVRPSLNAHSLTVTSLEFSQDDSYLLSVGRDRQWALFRRSDDGKGYRLSCSNPKGHSRMILDCSWAPSVAAGVFATAGRDKTVKVWKLDGETADCLGTISADAAVTAVAFEKTPTALHSLRLAYGTEGGSVHIVHLASDSLEVVGDADLDRHLMPSAAVNSLKWRPQLATDRQESSTSLGRSQLAVASDDTSVRIFAFDY